MRITLSIANPEAEDQDLLSLEIYPEMTVETLRSSIQAETRIAPSAQHLYHNGQLITDESKTMEQLHIGDGEMLALHVREMRGSTSVPTGAAGRRPPPPRQQPQQPQGGPSRSGAGMELDPEVIRLQILGNPVMRAQAQRQWPQIAAALDDPQRFAALLRENNDRERREQEERQRQIAALNADPFDPQAQAEIEEIIRRERVTENLQSAMEHNPEVFGRVHMLYLDVEVNNHRVKALVDSGAQATIMSPQCAVDCGIMRLVDKRFAGVAKGVGTANIIGRVHSAQIKIGRLHLPCSFTVMEGKSVDLLLGLDMLKRYQAVIDLGRDRLMIQGEEVPFLGEADIPKETEEALNLEPTVPGPGGTTIGQRSGAVSTAGASASGSGATATASVSAAGGPGTSASATVQAGGPSATTSSVRANPGAAAAAAAAASYPEEDINTLISLGFTREAAINALNTTGGNVEYAASLLFQQ